MGSKSATTRRRFFRQAGAALSIPLAGGAAAAASGSNGENDDIGALRALNAALVHAVNAADEEALAALIGDVGRAFPQGRPSRLAADPEAGPETVAIDTGRRRAATELGLIAEMRQPIGPRCTLVDMAIAQGEGFVRRVTPLRLQIDYVRTDDGWVIDSIAASLPAKYSGAA